MRHHQYNPDFKFIKDPEDFDRYTPKPLLQYCLGATMYMPGTKDFADAILQKKYPGLTSMVMCFEDACRPEDVPAAEENALNLLDRLDDELERGSFAYEDLPLIIFRVRNIEQYKNFCSRLRPEHARVITAINFPKCDSSNAREYFSYLAGLSDRLGERVYGMPIIESRSVAYIETRQEELLSLKEILDEYREYVLNIRVGGTDFSGCFGVRRGINYTIYDILPVRDCLKDILNIFGRNNDYTISGPVWEYFRANTRMKFQEIPNRLNESLFRREPIVNDAVDGLLRELLLDRANGFIGKTIIHPTHLPYVNGMMAVTKEIYDDAVQILGTDSGVIKSGMGNKMNEIGPHQCWAEKILMRARAYGVIEDESQYLALFTGSRAGEV